MSYTKIVPRMAPFLELFILFLHVRKFSDRFDKTKGNLGYTHMGVSKNNGTPKSSILMEFAIIFTIPFGGFPPIFGYTHIN